MPNDLGYENPELCRRCRGVCCKHAPGATGSADWLPDLLTALTEALVSLRYVIDWRDPKADEDAVYFVRPATAGFGQYGPTVYHGGWGGACAWLTEHGCELPLRRRPRSCRMLEPRLGGWGWGEGHCWAHVSHRTILRNWERHQATIHAAARIALERLGRPVPRIGRGVTP